MAIKVLENKEEPIIYECTQCREEFGDPLYRYAWSKATCDPEDGFLVCISCSYDFVGLLSRGLKFKWRKGIPL